MDRMCSMPLVRRNLEPLPQIILYLILRIAEIDSEGILEGNGNFFLQKEYNYDSKEEWFK